MPNLKQIISRQKVSQEEFDNKVRKKERMAHKQMVILLTKFLAAAVTIPAEQSFTYDVEWRKPNASFEVRVKNAGVQRNLLYTMYLNLEDAKGNN